MMTDSSRSSSPDSREVDPSLSPLLRSMPWFTTFVTAAQGRLNMLPSDLQIAAVELLRAFQKGHTNIKYAKFFNNEHVWQPNEKSAGPIATMLFGFRFLDVAAMVNDVEVTGDELWVNTRSPSFTPDSPVPRTTLEGDTAKIRGISAIGQKHGWPRVIQDVCRLLGERRDVSDPSLSVDEMQIPPDTQLLLASLRQFRSIKERDDKIALQKHILNLETAAFFINWMLQGNMDFPTHTKDLLESLRRSAEAQDVPSHLFPALRVTADDDDLVCKFPDVTKLRQPLFLALAVSPLILLSDVSTTSSNLNRVHMARAWYHYGNQRPPILSRIEGMLWQELFAMARGRKSSVQALQCFLAKAVPLLPLAMPERFFFSPDAGQQAIMPTGISYDVQAIFRPGCSSLPSGMFSLHGTDALAAFLNEQKAWSQPFSHFPPFALSELWPVSHSPQRYLTYPTSIATPLASTSDAPDDTMVVDDTSISPHDPLSPLSSVDNDPSPPDVDEDESVLRRSERTKNDVDYAEMAGEDSDDSDEDEVLNGPSESSTSSTSTGVRQAVPVDDSSSVDGPQLLVSDQYVRRVFGESYMLFTPDGRSAAYRPSVYTHDILSQIETLIDRANLYQRHTGWRPLFVKLTDTDDTNLGHSIKEASRGSPISGLSMLTCEEYDALDHTRGLSPLLRRFHIYVPAPPQYTPGGSMSKSVLMDVGSCSVLRQAHDLSLRGLTDDPNDQIVLASFNDYLRELRKGTDGKVLNFLDVPSTDSKHATSSLSTNMCSHRYTVAFPMYQRGDDRVPVYDINWHLLASQHASHPAHIDANGFNTELYVDRGAKLVLLGQPDPKDPFFIASAEGFKDFQFDLSGPESHGVIGVLMLAGDRLVMRAGTPHYVVTLEPALCHGAHFYAVPTMERTNWSIIHTFFRSHEITNQEHPCYYDILTRIVVHWHDVIVNNTDYYMELCKRKDDSIDHLPNVCSIGDLLQALSLFNLIDIGTLLDHGRYEGDRDTALEVLYADIRPLVRQIIATLDAHLHISAPKSAVITFDEVSRCYLAQQLVALVHVAQGADDPVKSAARVRQLLIADLRRDPGMLSQLKSIFAGRRVRFGPGMMLDIDSCKSLRWHFAYFLEDKCAVRHQVAQDSGNLSEHADNSGSISDGTGRRNVRKRRRIDS